MKLTPSQVDLLLAVKAGRDKVASYYPPAKKLVAAGLCEWRAAVGTEQCRLKLTEAGEARVKQELERAAAGE
jgi:hypothetical protein